MSANNAKIPTTERVVKSKSFLSTLLPGVHGLAPGFLQCPAAIFVGCSPFKYAMRDRTAFLR